MDTVKHLKMRPMEPRNSPYLGIDIEVYLACCGQPVHAICLLEGMKT